MKRAYIKNVFRTILNNKRRYVAILAIVSLGIAFFVGLRSTSPDMNLTLDKYFYDQNMYDIRVLSTLGIDEKDVDAIRSVSGVAAVMPAYYCDEFIQVNEGSYLTRFHSLNISDIHNNTAMNVPVLFEGEYPKNGDECLLDYRYFRINDCTIGDYIYVSTGDESDIFDDMKFDAYKIVGAVESPMYITDSVGTTSKGRGYVSAFVYIPEESFNADIYTEAYVRTDTAELSRFSSKYEDAVKEIADNIKQSVGNSIEIRRTEIIADAEKDINEGRTKIADGKQELQDGLNELNNAREELDKAKADFASQKAEFEEQKSQFIKSFEIYGDISLLPPDVLYMYQAGIAEFETNEELINASSAELDNHESTLQSNFEEYYEKEADANEEFAKAETELADAETELAKFINEPAEAYALDLGTNIGFVSFKGDSDRINAISYVFPSIFFLVAALVTLTNMMRIVEDDRSAVGVLKSLGYNKYYIFAKYIIYVILVTVPGVAIGVLVGYDLFPSSIYNMGYKILYNTPGITTAIHPGICIFAGLLAFISIIVPTIAVCYGEIVSPPANLIRPKAPHSGKRIILERVTFIWNRMSFFAKVTSRNILRYKKRFFMTVAGIAGCTALLVTGFGIMDSIKYIPVKQFKDIFLYDGVINLKDKITDEEKDGIEKLFEENDNIWLYTYNMAINVESDGRIEEVTLTVPQDISKCADFYVFNSKDKKTRGEKFYLENDGVVLTEKICSLLNLSVGDTVTLISDNVRVSAKLSGICENYVNNYLYVTPATYAELFGAESIKYNTVLCRTDNNTEEKEDALSTELLKLDGINGLSFNTRTINFYSDMINSLNFVVVILVLSAAALAFIVLFSLTAINIDERMRELATLKVLGFYNSETSSYIFRENIILTIIGTAVGLLLGIVLHRFVIMTVEIDMVMFSKDILPLSFIYSALLTLLFSLIVNFAMNFSIKKINMVESLKSVE